ncbi:MAG: hypothetical protein R3213_12090 [Flavobacteriaceae bacterium]|nr:hypothetical protein [Flavobacteriaceae bacterium]
MLDWFLETHWIGKLLILLVLAGIGYGAWWAIFIRYAYSEKISVTATVVDMDYTAPKTHIHSSGKTHYTTTTPAKHEVYIVTEKGKRFHFDHERLYETVRMDDEVKITYQEEYKYHKNRPNDKKFNGNRVIDIESPKGRIVHMNNEEPVTYFGRSGR